MKIFITGSGKLARAILASNEQYPTSEIQKWEPSCQSLSEKLIIIHAGSGRQLDECLEYCKKTKSILIELSTGLKTEKMLADFPLIICPNTSVLVLKTLHMLQSYGDFFKSYEISITESHQASKKTEAGTAYAFAGSLNFPVENIHSVRNPELQLKMGIPQEYLEKHAYHKIVIKDAADEICIETRVLGHDSYAKGVRSIIEAVLKNDLENKKYTVTDLIKKRLI